MRSRCQSPRAGAASGPDLLLVAEWPWKVRVGENSPSLWPTMFSVTKTGMNFRPLCTAKVWPTNSGRMVDRRDQVLTTFFWLLPWCMSSIFFDEVLSTKGPFLIERAICVLLYWLLRRRLTMNLSVRLFLRVLRPLVFWPHGETGWRTALAALAFATADRVIDRVHRDAADVRPEAEPAAPAGLAEADDHRGRCCRPGRWWRGRREDPADLARGQADLGAVAFLGHQLAGDAGRAAELRPAAGLDLDVVDRRADRDVRQRQQLPGLMSAVAAADDGRRRP